MKILHIVTYLDEDGAFGGPARVAQNQTDELARQGHSVTLMAAAPVKRATEEVTESGVRVRLFPAQRVLPREGFAAIHASGLIQTLKHSQRSVDVVHVHLARDLVTLPAAWVVERAKVPLVVQAHGMILPSAHPLARPLDAVATGPVLRRAAAVYVLNDEERRGLADVARGVTRFRPLHNGVPIPAAVGATTDVRRAPKVVFLARLHPVKRPVAFVEAAAALLKRGVELEARVAGPDGGALEEARAAAEKSGVGARICFDGAISPPAVSPYLASCDIYVLPSVTESFGMSVLEAMAVGRPVIVTEGCALAPLILEAGAGLVVPVDEVSLEPAICRLVVDQDLRVEMGRAARRLAARFGIDTVAEELLQSYREVVSPAR